MPLRVAMTGLLLAVVALRIDWSTLASRLRHANAAYLLAAVAAIALALVIGAYRWRGLLIGAGIKLSTSEIGRVYAVSTFSGTFLPTSVGGDVTRTFLVSRRRSTLARIAVTVLVDRAAALVGLLSLAWIGVVFTPTQLPHGTVIALAWSTAVLGCLGGAAVALIWRDSQFVRRLTSKRLQGMVAGARQQVRQSLQRPSVLAMLATSSLAFQALVAIQIMLLGHAIGVSVDFPLAAVAVTLATLATLIPISIGGFGVREGTYVAILGASSINATDATLISLMTVFTLFAASLPGAYLLARRGLTPVLSEAPAP